jgi:serine protease AprX
MPDISIIAYHYTREEEDFILEHVRPLDRTPAFIFGVIDVRNISELKKRGILLDIVQSNTGSDKVSRNIGYTSGAGRFVQYNVDLSGIGPVAKKDLFLLQLRGPLLPSWKKALEGSGTTVIEYLQNDVYKVHTSRDIAFLSSLEFVLNVRPFESSDTEVVMKRSVTPEEDVFAPIVNKIAIYDIKAYPDHTETILDVLRKRNVEIIASTPGKIRIRLEDTHVLTELRKSADVIAIEEFVRPELHNDRARIILNIERKEPGPNRNITPFEGEGQVVGVADTGIDAEHPDLKDRLFKVVARGRRGDASDPNGHGTHVAGSIVGNGTASNGLIRGIAPKAKIFFQSVMDSQGYLGGLPLDLGELFQEAYDAGVRVHNNSWGAFADSEYLFNSLEVDEFVYNHKDMLLVISGGNEGTAFQPRNSKSGFVDWLSLGSPATAKNALTVGASRSDRKKGGFASLTWGQAWPDVYPEDPIRGQKISGDPDCLAGFSSRGPCGNESRIKPDVVAPGTDIASTKSSTAPVANFWGPFPKNRHYAYMGGTSMSAPIVSGFATLIREYFMKEWSHSPSAALLKSAIINSTRLLSGPDALADHSFLPNYHQGFGCVDLRKAIPNTLEKQLNLAFIDSWRQENLQFSSTGERFLFVTEVKEGVPLRVCLTWTDKAGRGLQNNLNLFVMHRSSQYKWTGNSELPRTITAFDRDNNVEIIRVENPQAGEYLIAVQAANIIFSPQDFALTVTGNLQSQLSQI